MTNETKKPMSKTAKTIFFYIDILMILLALFLVGGNLYGNLVNGNSIGAGLFVGIVVGIYGVVGIFRDNPYKTQKNDTSNKSDSGSSQT